MPFVAVAVTEDRTPAGPLAESFSWTPGMTSPFPPPPPLKVDLVQVSPRRPFLSPKGARGSGRGHPLSFCVWGYKYTLFTLPDDTRVIFFFSSSCLPLDTCLKDKAVLE